MPDAEARHLISLADLPDSAVHDIVARGAALRRHGAPAGALAGSVVAAYFRRTSTRTRTAFSSAALRLGAGLITYGPDDLQLNTGESTEDTGRVLVGMVDVLVARTADSTAEMRTWANQNRMAVVNAMSAEEHPTQGLADLTTLTLRFGAVDGLRIVYVGEGNNTAAALALGICRYHGVRLDLHTPPGYGLDPTTLAWAKDRAAAAGSTIAEHHDLGGLPPDADVVYTTRWQTTGTSKPDPRWRETFRPFRVDRELMDRMPKAVFMHDLPAHRGEEVSAEVLDGAGSIAFDQAENKMYSAMAVLEWCRGNR
jgi:ornithine carbamoyltransferase